MTDEISLKIIERLNVLIKLTAANLIVDMNFDEQVRLLSSVGLQPKEIADLLNKTANHVSVTLTKLKKKSIKRSNS